MFPMVLPKGIVVNSADIYAEVAGYPTVPPEKIWEYWHVYTTTFRKLIDPTAHRLENFWWHVWGSDRRFLSGATLARLFEEISTGPSFSEAQGLSRGPRGPGHTLQHGSIVGPDSAVTTNQPPLKPLSSSSSKPPPPHPILKKTRGPSSSGPRPTARFVSPHESDQEREGPAPKSKSMGQETAGISKQDPAVLSPQERLGVPNVLTKKKGTPSGSKRHTAFTSTSKRRPYVARRSGSQSSGGSAEGPSLLLKGAHALHVPPKRRVKPVNATVTAQSKVANEVEAPPETGDLSEKAVGKRRVEGTRTASDMMCSPQIKYQETLPLHKPRTADVHPRPKDRYGGAQPSSLDLKRSPHPPGFEAVLARNQSARDVSHWGVSPSPPASSIKMERSMSDREGQRIFYGARDHAPLRGLTSSTTTTTFSSVAAQGTFDFDQTAIPTVLEAREEEEKESEPDMSSSQRDSSSILGSRFTPTAPNPTPDVEMGRTKSQLTLLLEQGRSRLGSD